MFTCAINKNITIIFIFLSVVFIISCDSNTSNDNNIRPLNPIKQQNILVETPNNNNYKQLKTGCDEASLPGCKPR